MVLTKFSKRRFINLQRTNNQLVSTRLHPMSYKVWKLNVLDEKAGASMVKIDNSEARQQKTF